MADYMDTTCGDAVKAVQCARGESGIDIFTGTD